MYRAGKSIRDRINDSFSTDDKDSLKYYLDSVAGAWKDYADGIRRSATIMLILIAVFELLLSNSAQRVTFGPVVLTGVTTVITFIPTVVAYFYYESWTYLIAFGDISKVYSTVFAIWNPTAEENDLDAVLQPGRRRFPPPDLSLA